MANILKQYTKQGIVITGDDNVELDTPAFEIIDIRIDTINKVLHVEILHKVQQGNVIQEHSRTFEVNFVSLPSEVKTTGKSFLDAIEEEILNLPQYQGSLPM